MIIKILVESHISDSVTKDEKNISISGINWKAGNTELYNTNRGNQEQNNIEHKAIQPCFPSNHGMKPTTKWQSNTKLDISLLYTPQNIKTQICEYEHGQEPCINILQLGEHLVHKWYQW